MRETTTGFGSKMLNGQRYPRHRLARESVTAAMLGKGCNAVTDAATPIIHSTLSIISVTL